MLGFQLSPAAKEVTPSIEVFCILPSSLALSTKASNKLTGLVASKNLLTFCAAKLYEPASITSESTHKKEKKVNFKRLQERCIFPLFMP